MRRLVVGGLLVWLGLAAACSDDDPQPAASDGSGDGGAATEAGDGGAATEADAAPDAPGSGEAGPDGAAEAGPDAPICTPPATPPILVFLNRGGGTFTPGADDSQANTSPLVSSTSTVTAWTVAEADWQTLLACVNAKLAPFNVTITDADPGAQGHLEVVYAQASLPALLGQPAIAPFTCKVVPKAISLVSQAYAEANLTNGCAVTVQNIAYSLGLESVTTCPDAMTFNPTPCADAAFTNVPLPCGTNAAASCQCVSGATTQSSHARLLAVTGPRCL